MKRNYQLDALRGIAALAVVFSHLWLTLPNEWHMSRISLADAFTHRLDLLLKYSPGRILVAGPAAVALFFVLSGFVLSASIEKTQNLDYASFFVRRVCRIFLPFLAAMVLAMMLFGAVGAIGVDGVSEWFTADTWSEPLSGSLALGHLLMFGTRRFQTLDPPMWSLVVEMRVSLIFPLLFALLKLWPLKGSGLVGLFYFAASLYMTYVQQTLPEDQLASLAFTLQSLPLFALGILLYLSRDKISRSYQEAPRFVRRGLLIGVGSLFCFPSMGPVTTLNLAVKLEWAVSLGLASSAAIILALNSVVLGKVLSAAPLQWVGRISYSLYLTHMLVLLTLVRLLSGYLSVPAILPLAVPCSIGLAFAMHRWIELPSIRLGQVVVGGLSRLEKTAAHSV